MTRPHRFAALLGLGLGLAACQAEPTQPAADAEPTPAADAAAESTAADAGDRLTMRGAVLRGYADLVHQRYASSLAGAEILAGAIDAFLAEPTEATLSQAREAWLKSRRVYGLTEAYRFYDGPIDNAEDGPEGRINAWPLDEAYLDYVEGQPEAGIINQVDAYPQITAELLVSLNEQGGEKNIATGWHAIEFLLWGQDLSENGPGARPAADFVAGEGPNAERRRQVLQLLIEQLQSDLKLLVDAWDPGVDGNYRAGLLAAPVEDGLQKMLVGMGSLSGAELAGERMAVAFDTRDQEDEHSCFSDSTHDDLLANQMGIVEVWNGGGTEPSLASLVAEADPALAAELTAQAQVATEAVKAIPAPFDATILAPDGDPARVAFEAAIEALEAQTALIGRAATALGLTINVAP